MRRLKTLTSGVFYLAMMSFASCTGEETIEKPLYVVEAFVFSGEPVQGVTIKELSPLDSGSNATAHLITDAHVLMKKDGITYNLDLDPVTKTYFYPGFELEINPGDLIMLEVDVNGRRSFGETQVPHPPKSVRKNMEKLVVPPLEVSLDLRDRIIGLFSSARLVIEWDNEGGELHYVVVHDRVAELDPILPEIVPDDARELLSSFRFISEPSEATRFEVVGVALVTYGTYVVKVFRVNQEYADLFRNDTQDSRDLNAPPSNIVGAFGIFSAFSSDSVAFEVVRE